MQDYYGCGYSLEPKSAFFLYLIVLLLIFRVCFINLINRFFLMNCALIAIINALRIQTFALTQKYISAHISVYNHNCYTVLLV